MLKSYPTTWQQAQKQLRIDTISVDEEIPEFLTLTLHVNTAKYGEKGDVTAEFVFDTVDNGHVPKAKEGRWTHEEISALWGQTQGDEYPASVAVCGSYEVESLLRCLVHMGRAVEGLLHERGHAYSVDDSGDWGIVVRATRFRDGRISVGDGTSGIRVPHA